MGLERLIRALAAGFALAATSCGNSRDAAAPVAPSAARHAHVIHTMKSPERIALVERFRRRNGPEWTVNPDALLQSETVIDPFVGFIRRARSTKEHAPATEPIGEADAVAAARGFVRKNADLLGVPQSMVLSLFEETRVATPADHGSPRARWLVKLEGTFPTKGYETFPELTNEVEVEVFVDDDGSVSSFMNLSKIVPRLAIDTRPGLAQTDARLYRELFGRRVFAVTESGDRVELGVLDHMSPIEGRLAIHVSRGPFDAWVTYRLAWHLVLARMAPSAEPLGFYFFYYLVDTDTGAILQDSPIPTQVLLELP